MTHPFSSSRSLVVLSSCLIFLALPLVAQQKKIETAPAQPTSAASGEEMYKSYCAACHGPQGKGNGPAASEFKTPPPDLTMLAKRNNGKFPDARVRTILQNGAEAPAHGSADMPVWGPVFSAVSQNKPQIVSLRISNLASYLESIQTK
jgi:mono/diheme cytochrome c family protein